MSKSANESRNDFDIDDRTHKLTITWNGELASHGEIPAAELGAALQGWDRFLQLAYYSYQSSDLQVPKQATNFHVDFRVRRVRKGSFVVEAVIALGGITTGVISNAAYDLIKKVGKWSGCLVQKYIQAKTNKKTLDGVVDDIEEIARENNIRVSIDREDTEGFVAALNNALDNATVSLDSSAATEVLKVEGLELEIVIDKAGRQAIKVPFEPPSLDTDADDVIEAAVKFIRINKKTGYGLLSFVRPMDASQLNQQRFHCDDKSIRRRANQYTGAFHEDLPLIVRMQRKNYAQERRGHYWLILGTVKPSDDGMLPYTKTENRANRGNQKLRKESK